MPGQNKTMESNNDQTDADIPEESDVEKTIIQKASDMPNIPLKSGWGSATFDESSTISLHVGNSTNTIVTQPRPNLTLGRLDVNGPKPDIDLSQFDAASKGVSRMHAALRLTNDTLVLVDLGSTNGTYLNEEFLTPNMPHILHDGDTIRLGSLILHIYFKA